MLTRDSVIVQRSSPAASRASAARTAGYGRAVVGTRWHAARVSSRASPAGATPPGFAADDVASGDVRRLGDDLGMIALLGGDQIASAGFADRGIAFLLVREHDDPERRSPYDNDWQSNVSDVSHAEKRDLGGR